MNTLFVLGLLYYLLVVGATAYAWVQTGSGWSFLILLGLFVSLHYRSGNDDHNKALNQLASQVMRVISILRIYVSHPATWYVVDILLDALHEAGFKYEVDNTNIISISVDFEKEN